MENCWTFVGKSRTIFEIFNKKLLKFSNTGNFHLFLCFSKNLEKNPNEILFEWKYDFMIVCVTAKNLRDHLNVLVYFNVHFQSEQNIKQFFLFPNEPLARRDRVLKVTLDFVFSYIFSRKSRKK